MAKKSASQTKKGKTAAKKSASKTSASKKPASKKATPKTSASKKPSGQKAASKKSTSKKTQQKSAAGKKKNTSSRTTQKKTAASRKSSTGKTTRRSTPQNTGKKPQPAPAKKTFSAYRILLFVLIAAALAIGAYIWFHTTGDKDVIGHHPTEQAKIPIKTQAFKKKIGMASPLTPGKNAPAHEKTEMHPAPEPEAKPASTNCRPAVAIIIDDMGRRKDMAEKFFSLDARFTYSILPYARYHREIAQSAAQKGYQVMLHLPMEPNEYPEIDPGPGALLTCMTPDERIRQLKTDLAAVPYIEGVNNHMGSKMTTMFPQMNQIFTVLKEQGLFFIDSRTTAASQCRSSARLFQLPFAERDVFLDHVPSRQAIVKRIEELINIAEINGSAIGIGHPHQITYEVLAEKVAEINRRVRLVPASELVR